METPGNERWRWVPRPRGGREGRGGAHHPILTEAYLRVWYGEKKTKTLERSHTVEVEVEVGAPITPKFSSGYKCGIVGDYV